MLSGRWDIAGKYFFSKYFANMFSINILQRNPGNITFKLYFAVAD